MLGWAGDRLMVADGVLPGWIVDLGHLGRTLTGGDDGGFGGFCAAFGVDEPGSTPDWRPGESVDAVLGWGRARLDAEVGLHEAFMAELDAWRDGGARRVRPPWLYSGGGLGRQVVASAGYTPPAGKADLPDEVAGAAAAAFYGGRTEASLLRCPTPTVVMDFSSNYLTVAALLGVGRLFEAERITAEDVTDKLRAWLADLEASRDPVGTLRDPAIWDRWGITVAMVEPAGEWLPYRALVAPGEVTVGFNPLSSAAELPYCWADLAAAVVKGGRAPRVLRAWRLVTHGQVTTRPVRLVGSSVSIGGDEDLFVALLRARSELACRRATAGGSGRDLRRREAVLKRLGNVVAYGNASRFDREPATGTEPTRYLDPWGGSFATATGWDEHPERWTFLPAAAGVCAGARLAVALAERAVCDAGGSITAVHTDSLMIPASPDGGVWTVPAGHGSTRDGDESIRLLSWPELDAVFEPFDSLRLDGGRAWKAEHGTRARVLHAAVYGANRYVIFDPATGEVVHGTESHLGGVLVDPSGCDDDRLPDGRRRWVAQAHQTLLPGQPPPLPWVDRPAVSAWRATTLEQLGWLRRLPGMGDAQPFTAFLLARPARRPRQRAGTHRQAVAGASPIAVYDPRPQAWGDLAWRYRDGTPTRFVTSRYHAVVAGHHLGQATFVAATVADVLDRWQTGGDFGATPRNPNAPPATWVGRYRRLDVEAVGSPALIGREGDRLLETHRGVTVDPTERLTVIAPPGTHLGGVPAEIVRDLAARYQPRLAGTHLTAAALRGFLDSRNLQARNLDRLLAALDPLTANDLLDAGLSSDNLADMSRAARYHAIGRLHDGTATVHCGQVEERCALPGCARPRRRSDPYCSHQHHLAATGRAVGCARPGCDQPARPRGRYCSDQHRRRARPDRSESRAPIRIQPRHPKGPTQP